MSKLRLNLLLSRSEKPNYILLSVGFLKIKNSLQVLVSFSKFLSSLKGFCWQNMRKSVIWALTFNSRYLLSRGLKNGKYVIRRSHKFYGKRFATDSWNFSTDVSANMLKPDMKVWKCYLTRQEIPRSPSILPNGEYQVNPALTVRFLISKNVRLIRLTPRKLHVH